MRDEGGQAVVEFALVLPLLLTIVFAIVQFGIVFNHYLNLTDAVRAGARTASVSAGVADPVAATKAAVVQAAPGLDSSELSAGTDVTSGWHSGDPVTVTASYPYTISIFGIPAWSGSLSSRTTERVE